MHRYIYSLLNTSLLSAGFFNPSYIQELEENPQEKVKTSHLFHEPLFFPDAQEAVFLQTLEMHPISLIDKILLLQDADGNNLLHVLASRSEHTFISYINKCSVTVLSEAVLKENKRKKSALENIVMRQTERSFQCLLKKISTETLLKGLKNNLGGLFGVCCRYSTDTIEDILRSLELEQLNQVFTKTSVSDQLLIAVVKILLTNCNNNNQLKKICEALDTLSSERLLKILEGNFLKGQNLPTNPVQIKLLQTLLKKHTLNPLREYILEELDNAEHQWASSHQELYYSTQEIININDNDLVKKILEKGVNDYTTLRALYRHPLLSQKRYILDVLARNNFRIPREQIHSVLNKKMENIDNLTRNGDVVMKTFSSSTSFMRHVEALEGNRIPNIRRPIMGHADTKFFHTTGKIDAYKPARCYQSAKKKSPHAQKTSVTAISPYLDTQLFPGVIGLMYSADPTQDKAWLNRTAVTYNHEWIDEKLYVLKYASYISNFNHTDYQQFKEKIASEAHTTNEVLSRVNKDRLLAIILINESEESKKNGIKYAKYIKHKLGLDLPILFYQPAFNALSEFTTYEQECHEQKAFLPEKNTQKIKID